MRKIILLLAIFLNGCAVIAHTPMNRFESPEVQGATGGVEGFLAYQARNDVQLTDFFPYETPSLADPTVEQPSHRFMVEGALGLGRRWDIELSVPEARLGAKFQILGAPRKESAAGNFSLSVYGGVAYAEDDDSTFSFTNQDQDLKYQLRQVQLDIGLVAGYRIINELMVYGGPFAIHDSLRTGYNLSPGADLTVAESAAVSYGVNLGLQWTIVPQFFVRGEIAGTKTRLGDANVGRESEGLAVGCSF